MVYCQNLAGTWQADVLGLGSFQVTLPGTLDTNGVGGADKPFLRTRLTRKHTFEGTVRYKRTVQLPHAENGERLFLRIERTREAALFVNSSPVPAYEAGSLSTPYLFELTPFATSADESERTVLLSVQVDNRYTAFPRESIINSSAATDETQTNWNGVLGDFALYTAKKAFIRSLRIYPHGTSADVLVEADGVTAADFLQGARTLKIESAAFTAPVTAAQAESMVPLADAHGILLTFRAVPLKENCRLWDESEGALYDATATLTAAESTDAVTVQFGVRTFAAGDDCRLKLNGRSFFLRGEANCAVFPETGHPPLTADEWQTVLESYRAYGVNCMRFHSWCPPDAAFSAADRLGMLMQPELSQWNFSNAFGTEKARAYYKHELVSILRALANHPSFVMLTFGNELQYTEEGEAHCKLLLKLAHELDSTRLYAKSSNYHYGNKGVDAESDFYTAAKIHNGKLRAIGSPMRGHLNENVPSSCTDYTAATAEAIEKHKPLFGFEVGQYEILPDNDELASFKGVTVPENYQQVQNEVTQKGLRSRWRDYVEATGELALIAYREEVEAVLRTPNMSGLSLLGLQDFPGQGTALVGMMNTHLEPKPFAFARPERFRAFFTDALPLLYLDRYTYRAGEALEAKAAFAYYGKKGFSGKATFALYADGECLFTMPLGTAQTESTGLLPLFDVAAILPEVRLGAARLDAVLSVGLYKNSYPLWVFPDYAPLDIKADGTTDINGVIVTRTLTDAVLSAAENGATIFFEPQPTAEAIPASVENNFSTDFWSVGTFPVQSGTMGLCIDDTHAALAGFPTERHSNYQWWRMSKGRAMLLPSHITPIIAVPDCIDRMRHMGVLFEAQYGKGRLLVSSMNVVGQQDAPECLTLLYSILAYAQSDAAKKDCKNSITKEELTQIFGAIA